MRPTEAHLAATGDLDELVDPAIVFPDDDQPPVEPPVE